ncbi:MAG: hypothetical protein O3A50_10515, partial [Planctomycetota bacterium]|nr:hypothetical protein [Planctomycetota bacterium]
RLRWTAGEQPVGRVRRGAAWIEEQARDGSFQWRSGILSPAPPFPGITAVSASSLRNGVRRDDQGRIVGWSPQQVRSADGQLHLVEDRFRDGSFDVIYVEPGGGAPVAVASSERFEAHASLALDGLDRVWVAWDEGRSNWGRGNGLHEQRALRLVMRDAEGWHEVPLPTLEVLVGESNSAPSPFPALAEMPRLVVSAEGSVWMFYRVMLPFTDPASRSASRKVTWIIRATCLTEEGWSPPVTLPQSDGPNHDTLAVMALEEGGVLAAWTTDLRRSRFEALTAWGETLMEENQLRVAELQLDGASAPSRTLKDLGPWQVQALELEPEGFPTPPEEEASRDQERTSKGYLRLWGDLHRHSDLSRCSMHTDGSVPDQYRYAASVGALDFLAVTDHHQHITKTTWSFLLDCAERFREREGMQPMFGFEAAFPDGHRNLISDRRDATAEVPFLASLAQGLQDIDAQRFVAIPHQMAARNAVLDWSGRIPELETQLEIYQRRGSYESVRAPRTARAVVPGADYARDHLLRGERFGFVASSDHQFSDGAFAVVLAKERNRASILEALHARRSYAATARIDLDVQLGDLVMGEAGAVATDALLQVSVDGGEDLARVEVVRNGAVVHRWEGASAADSEGTTAAASSDAVLTLRIGRLDGAPDLPLQGDGFLFGPAQLFDDEPGKASSAPGGEVWSPGIFLHYASQRAQALGGWSIPVRLAAAAGATRTLTLGDGDQQVSWTEEEMRGGSEWKRDYFKRPVSLRLAGPPLGRPQLQEGWTPGDWKAGDWVYVRVVRTDAAMAWSSPIWIDAAQ